MCEDSKVLLGIARKSWSFLGKTHDVTVSEGDLITLQAKRSARVVSSVDPLSGKLTHRGFQVNNGGVLAIMNSGLAPNECINNLYRLARKYGVFNLALDQYGLVVTSTAPENRNMHGNRWITDTLRTLQLVKGACNRAHILLTLAKFYSTDREQASFLRVLETPDLYRDLSLPKEGVAHIFQVEEGSDGEMILTRDPQWGNNRRLESHGLALKAFCEFLLGNNRGSPMDRKSLSYFARAIASLVLYFQAIDYTSAPSAGNWEEIPLPGGLTWDIESVRQGLDAFKKLMFGGKGSAIVRATIADIEEVGLELAHWMPDKQVATRILFDPQVVEGLIAKGAEKVRTRVALMAEAPGMRKWDASLVFVGQSDLHFSLDSNPVTRVIETSQAYLGMLDGLRHALVRPNGMIRYAPFRRMPWGPSELFDSYLSVNYSLGLDEEGYFNPLRTQLIAQYGSLDASDPEVFEARGQLSIKGREAEWFLVSDLSLSYTRVARRLLNLMQSGVSRSDWEHRAMESLFAGALEAAFDNLLRGYARITSGRASEQGQVKANGELQPSWGLPEAYQWVRIRRADDSGFDDVCLPGENTTLAWAQASLYRATKEFLSLSSCF